MVGTSSSRRATARSTWRRASQPASSSASRSRKRASVPGAKTLFSAIRNNAGASITRQVERGTLEFVRDPATQSVVLRSVEGESERWLSVLDETKKKWVGTFAVGDDGTREWIER